MFSERRGAWPQAPQHSHLPLDHLRAAAALSLDPSVKRTAAEIDDARQIFRCVQCLKAFSHLRDELKLKSKAAGALP